MTYLEEIDRLREEVKTQNSWAHDHLREVERLRTALRRVAEYDGEWVEGDPLVIRDHARDVLRGVD